MTISDWLSLTLVCILGATSPGPSLAVILAITRSGGRGSGLAASIGHGLGIFVYALAAATSLSYVLDKHLGLFNILQFAGALLLVWIGGKLLFAALRRNAATPVAGEPAPPKLGGSFANGFGIAILNPKIAAFFASLFSQFLAAGQDLGLHLMMALLAGFIDVAAYVLIVLLVSGKGLRNWMDRYHHLLDLLLGGMLLALGISLIVGRLFLV